MTPYIIPTLLILFALSAFISFKIISGGEK